MNKTCLLETNKSSLDVLFIYFIWWIQSSTVVQYLLPYTVLNVFNTYVSEMCVVLS